MLPNRLTLPGNIGDASTKLDHGNIIDCVIQYGVGLMPPLKSIIHKESADVDGSYPKCRVLRYKADLSVENGSREANPNDAEIGQ